MCVRAMRHRRSTAAVAWRPNTVRRQRAGRTVSRVLQETALRHELHPIASHLCATALSSRARIADVLASLTSSLCCRAAVVVRHCWQWKLRLSAVSQRWKEASACIDC